ncbi:MAG: hypothetical protein ACOYMD_13290 [Paludibacter sp.]
MISKSKKSINYYMRSLHRDIGFFLVGLTVIYCISGVILIYRDTDFLRHDKLTEKKLPPNMDECELGKMLWKRDFKILKCEGNILYFQNGTYNKVSGVVKYNEKELPSFLSKFNRLHKSPSKNLVHWFTTIYGILLLFLAVSSFWMFNSKTKLFRRGIFIASIGIGAALILLLI